MLMWPSLGEDRALILMDGRLGLDERFVWFDSSALEQACAEVDRRARTGTEREELDERSARSLAKRILDLYQGPFLGDRSEQPWALGARERLRTRFLRAISSLGDYFEHTGQWRRAADLYERGLESDPLAESLYRHLMRCYEQQGRPGEAIEIFNRCRRVLKAELDVEPSEETRDLYGRLSGA